jgi:DNA polymerase
MIREMPADEAAIAAGVQRCRRCDLYRNATQGVAGAGPVHAPIMMVGEQPGDEEDRQGLPFVGPAGRLLDRALGAVAIDRNAVFVTNAVKHFKWEPRGKRRIHKTPAQREVEACLYWLEQEIALVQPRVVVALGATALKALAGRKATLTNSRGTPVAHPSGVPVVATYHPAAVLRAQGEAADALYAALCEDLALAKRLVQA